MALDPSALLEVLDALKAADVDERVRQAATMIYQALVEAELTAVLGAAPHGRTETRVAHRTPPGPRGWGPRGPGIWSCGSRSCVPACFFPACWSVASGWIRRCSRMVIKVHLHGVSTRKIHDLVDALGADTGISKSEVTRICVDLNAEVGRFPDRSLAGSVFPYIFLDATHCTARVKRRALSPTVVAATGVRADGWREVPGLPVGDPERGPF